MTKYTTFNESSINATTNTSSLTINIYFSADNQQTYFSNTPLYCTCNGVTQSRNVSHPIGGSVSASFTFDNIPHNADGTKTVSWNWSCNTETYVLGTVTDSGNKVLTKINRTITNSVTGSDINGDFSVNYTKMATGNYSYKLRIGIPSVVTLDTIEYNTSDEVFTLSQSVIEDLYSRYTTTNTFNLGFAVETWSADGQTQISSGNIITTQATITGANPVFNNFDFEDINSTTLALTGNDQINVNGYSNIKITISNSNKAIPQKGATMKKYRIVVGGQTIDIDSNEAYKCSKANTVLCTLNGRKYYKTTNDLAFVGYYYSSSGYTGPILVGTTADSVKFTTEGQTLSGTQITYQGSTYYVGSSGYYMAGNQTSTEGFAIKLSNSVMTEQQAREILLDKLIAENNDIEVTINNSTTGTYQVYAIDSRNNSTLVTKLADSVKDYTPLVRDTNYSAERDDGGIGRNVTLTFSGTIWNDSFGAVLNGFDTAKYLFKKTDSSVWIDLADLGITPTNITPTITNNTFSFSGLIRSNNNDTTWDLDSSYDIKVILEDKLSSVEFQTVLASAIPNLSLSKNGVGIMCDYDETLGGLLQIGGEVYKSGIEFSTNEVKTGYKWINGEDVYAKVLTASSLANNRALQLSHNISNLKEIIICKYKWYDTTDQRWFDGIRWDNASVMIRLGGITSTTVYINCLGTDWSARTSNVRVILLYTKTSN